MQIMLFLVILIISQIQASENYEYEALFDFQEHNSSVAFSKFAINMGMVNNAYADPKMKLFIMKVNNTLDGQEAVESAETAANNAFSQYAIPLNSTQEFNSSIVQAPYGNLFELSFDEDTWVSIFHMKIFAGDYGHYAIFAGHMPSEFTTTTTEIAFEFIHDQSGSCVDAEWDNTSTSTTTDKPWAKAIGAAFAVWAVVFAGLCLLSMPNYGELFTGKSEFSFYLAMFASGVFLSTAFCLILFEATHLIMAETTDESLAIGQWSAMILLGFMLTPILQIIKNIFISDYDGDNTGTKAASTGGGFFNVSSPPTLKDKDGKEVQAIQSGHSATSLVTGIILGDFFHNFCDGIFIGTAFKFCNNDLAWSITAATVAHEIPQELSDFAILTTDPVNYSHVYALFINALSGLSVVVGAAIATGIDIGDRDVGMLLAFGGGTYVYLGTVELFDVETKYTVMTKIIGTLIFCIGAIAIGLVLLDHEHCEGESSGDSSSSGHAH